MDSRRTQSTTYGTKGWWKGFKYHVYRLSKMFLFKITVFRLETQIKGIPLSLWKLANASKGINGNWLKKERERERQNFD